MSELASFVMGRLWCSSYNHNSFKSYLLTVGCDDPGSSRGYKRGFFPPKLNRHTKKGPGHFEGFSTDSGSTSAATSSTCLIIYQRYLEDHKYNCHGTQAFCLTFFYLLFFLDFFVLIHIRICIYILRIYLFTMHLYLWHHISISMTL